MRRRIATALFFIGLYFFSFIASSAFAQDMTPKAGTEPSPVDVIVFLRKGCTHCEAEETFLDNLIKERTNIQVTKYRLENPDERKLWETFTTKQGISKVTPITVIGNSYIIGFDNETTTGQELIALIGRVKKEGNITDLERTDMQAATGADSACPEDGSTPCTIVGKSSSITLPFIGKIATEEYPLIVLSAILGFFDGFNPCAMWVLVTFLIILMQVGSRRKMLLFAGTFVVAETVMYFLIMTVWYKTWDFVRLDNWVTPIVGIISIVGGIFFLREWRKKELVCHVMNMKQQHKTHQKIRELATGKFTVVTFLGILAIAFSVNIIEFACSIGIPQAFTKILEMNQLSFLQSLGFIFIYIFFYMLDDFIVFAIALYGIDKLHLTSKYSKLSNLIGGIVMVILGLLLIFKPVALLF